jgi:hypothetical protein
LLLATDPEGVEVDALKNLNVLFFLISTGDLFFEKCKRLDQIRLFVTKMHEFENQEVEGVGFSQGKGFQVSKNNRKTSKT